MMPVATILKMPYAVRVALLTGVLALVVVGFLAIRVIVNHQGLDKAQSIIPSNTSSQAESLEELYQTQVRAIITAYVEKMRTADVDMAVATAQAKANILELKVPATERDAHLALVLDFDAMAVAIDEGATTSIDATLQTIGARLESNY